MAHIHDLIKQLRASNPALGDEIAREVEILSQRRAFGLNFERHTPEAVELPGRRVRVGDKVRVLRPRGETAKAESQRLWRVASIDGAVDERVAQLEDARVVADGGETSARVSDLVYVAEFRDPIYPGLVSTGTVERGGDKPYHSVINAENYHALQALLYTHRGKVDVIYIDPPYNTGNDGWIYNDNYVASDDMYRHSKWLAFIERRLDLAKELLSPTGVIIVAIGDDEHHRLRLLMDQVFGSSNFLANLTWQGGVSALAKHTGGGADYMLIYAREREKHVEAIGQWRVPKEGTEQVLAAGRRCWEESGHDPVEATRLLRDWWRPNRSRFDSGVSVYDRIDESGRIYFAGDLANGMLRPNLQYEVLHPATGKPVRMPGNGWRHEKGRMRQNIEEGLVLFGPDESTIPTLKRYLEDYVTQVPAPSFYRDRRSATMHLTKVLGSQRFPNPKDVSVLGRWIDAVAGRDGVILDFFGGSGSTAEAVMRLNEADGGTRSCILVTNNEVSAADAKRLTKAGFRSGEPEWNGSGVYQNVARPRLMTIASGERQDGSSYSDGIDQNVEFFTLTYEAPMRVQSHREFSRIAPLLWLRAGSRGRRIEELAEGWDVADTYGIIDDIDKTDAFVAAMTANPDAMIAFIVTDEDRFFEAIANALPAEVEVVRLYDSYLRNFEIDAMRGVR